MQKIIDYLNNKLSRKEDFYLRIKVSPGAPNSEFKDLLDDETLKLNIAAAPEKGKANRELIRFLAREMRINKNQVTIISGLTEKLKLIKISLK